MAERNFDTEREKRLKKGHTFTLGGQVFNTYPGMSVNFLARNDSTDEEVAPLARTLEFIRLMVLNEERERFDKMIAETYIEADDLLELSTWLIEVISKRPTVSPGSSGNGANRTGTGSKANSSEAAGETGKK